MFFTQSHLDELELKKKNFIFGTRTFEGVPNHVAIIADGNRRYGQELGISTEEAHKLGAENVVRLAERAAELGVRNITFWVMDTKNLQKRGKDEIKNLLKIFIVMAKKFRAEYIHKKGLRFKHIGARDVLPRKIVSLIEDLERESNQGDTATVNIALNYSGRDDLVRAFKKIMAQGYKPEDITEELISQHVDGADLKDPDVIIRTGKETRLSGFMSWQSAPSELYFPQDLFPAYTPDKLEADLKAFPQRQRRMGA